jgi:hemerythrin-like domain-containing protein
MDLLDRIEAHHREIVEQLEELAEPRLGKRERDRATRRMADALAAHMAVEEALVYPQAERALGENDLVPESREEHAIARVSLQRVVRAGSDFHAKVVVLKDMVVRHVELEEREMLSALARVLSPRERDELARIYDARYDLARRAGWERARSATRTTVQKSLRI